MRRVRGLVALAALLAVMIGMPWAMAATIGNPLRAWSALRAGDHSDHTIIAILAAISFAAFFWVWASFLIALGMTTAEAITARLRGRPRRQLRVPGLGWQLDVAHSLLATTLLLLPAAASAAGPPVSAHAAPSAAPPATSASAAYRNDPTATPGPTGSPHGTQPAPDRTAGSPRRLETYVVPEQGGMRSYWALSEHYYGDPYRWPDIWHANEGHTQQDGSVMSSAHLLRRGWTVLIPIDKPPADGPATSTAKIKVTADEGDTLWSIEQQATGSGANWTSGWAANRDRLEPGGERFTDPNLIKPDWTLDIPVGPGSVSLPTTHPGPSTTAPAPPHPTQQKPPPQHRNPATPTTPDPSPTPTAPSRPAPAQSHDPAQPKPAVSSALSSSEHRYVDLERGAGLLVAGTLATLIALRLRKFRRRAAGRLPAPLPAQYAELEETLLTVGAPALDRMNFLNLALRDLTRRAAQDPDRPLPDVEAALLSNDYLELILTAPSGDAPEPWITTAANRWTLPRDADLPPEAAQFAAPYPCLVSVGYTSADSEYLIDLEHAGALRLVGDPDRCLALAHYMVAELANNIWADHLTVTLAGFAAEMTIANPARIVTAATASEAVDAVTMIAEQNREISAERHVDVLAGRASGTAGDLWMPRVLLAAPGELDGQLERITAATGPERTAVAVVLAGGQSGQPVTELTITESGQLRMAGSSLDLTAMGLPAATTVEIAQAIALDRDGVVDCPAPPAASDEPWAQYSATTGALLPDHTLPRTAALNPADIGEDASSLLPDSDELYVEQSATTAEELAALAPAVSASTRRAVERSDPDLDEQVAAWLDEDLKVARWHALGPVRLEAYGVKPTGIDLCLEATGYLKGKRNGVTTQQFADALWPDRDYDPTENSYPRTVAGRVRDWLGIDPRTGREYLSRANTPGEWTYRLLGLLDDEELFTRLYRRGQARGHDGRADLITALRLVTGQPYSKRRREWNTSWWHPGDAQTPSSAIQDVAQTVATWAIEESNFDKAVWACDVSLLVDADGDRALCQKARALELAGQDAEHQAIVLRLKSRDEDMDPRTLETMRRHGWLARGA